MKPPREDLYRLGRPATELRAGGDGEPIIAEGYITVFGEAGAYEIDSAFEGNFVEIVAPGAAKRTIAHNALPGGGSKIKVQVNHGSSGDGLLIGRFLDLHEDHVGIAFVAELFPDAVAGMLEGLRAGAYGVSHRFRCLREEFWNDAKSTDWNPKGLPVRVLREIELREAGPVSFPASDTASIKVRSLADEIAFTRLMQLPRERIEAMARMFAPDAAEATSAPPATAATRREYATDPESRRRTLQRMRIAK